MSNGHSYLPPSGAASWVVCHAWPVYNAMFPGTDSEASIEGQEAHDEARKSLLSYQDPNGTIYIAADPDVRGYVNQVLKVAQECGGLRKLQVERCIPIETVHEQCWGTPDAWLYDDERGILHVFDLKFGYGVVEVFENWQLITYAVGIMPELLESTEPFRVKFHISQPRASHREGSHRVWETLGTNLRGYVNQLRYAAEKIVMGDMTATPGKHCLHCPGRHQCPAAEQWANAATRFATAAEFTDLTPEQLGRELIALDVAEKAIEARKSGLFAQAEALALAGEPVYGWQLQDGVSRLNWTLPQADVYALGDLMGVDLRVTKPCTPTQAINAGIDGAVIGAYANRSTTRKLARVDTNKLREIFNNEDSK
jgi:hypothetical protein